MLRTTIARAPRDAAGSGTATGDRTGRRGRERIREGFGVVLELSVAWHTLFGMGRSADRHGLRLSAGMSMIPFAWVR